MGSREWGMERNAILSNLFFFPIPDFPLPTPFIFLSWLLLFHFCLLIVFLYTPCRLGTRLYPTIFSSFFEGQQ